VYVAERRTFGEQKRTYLVVEIDCIIIFCWQSPESPLKNLEEGVCLGDMEGMKSESEGSLKETLSLSLFLSSMMTFVLYRSVGQITGISFKD